MATNKELEEHLRKVFRNQRSQSEDPLDRGENDNSLTEATGAENKNQMEANDEQTEASGFDEYGELSGGEENNSEPDVDGDDGGDRDDGDGEDAQSSDGESDNEEERERNFLDYIRDANLNTQIIDPYSQGTRVYKDRNVEIFVKSVAHKKRNQYDLEDHLYEMTFRKTDRAPLLLNMEKAIRSALLHIFDKLKQVYPKQNQHQIYTTIIGANIQNGLNSGNYSLNTPSVKMARWVLSILYNYLKSKQTLKLTKSFKIMIKVLSTRHMLDLINKKKKFRPHIYH